MNRYTVTIVINGQDESRIVEADRFENGDDGLVRFYKGDANAEKGWGDKTFLVDGTAVPYKLVLAVPAANVAGIEPRS